MQRQAGPVGLVSDANDLGDGYLQCPGCGLYYVDTGCGQDREHENCPYACGICGKLIIYTPLTIDACPGHTIDEHRLFVAELRKRTPRTPGR